MSAAPPTSRYSNAPRTISSGAWSPPMASTAIRMGLCGGALRLDLQDLASAERPAVRADLVRWLGTLALRTRHKILRFERQMTAALALRGVRNAFLRMTCQGVALLCWGPDVAGKAGRVRTLGTCLIVWAHALADRRLRAVPCRFRAACAALAVRGRALRTGHGLCRPVPHERDRRYRGLSASRQALRPRLHAGVPQGRPRLVGPRAQCRDRA